MPQPPAAAARLIKGAPIHLKSRQRAILSYYRTFRARGAQPDQRKASYRPNPNGDFDPDASGRTRERPAPNLSTLGISDTLWRGRKWEIAWGHRRLWPKCATWPSRHKPSGFRGIGHPACFLGNQSLLNLSPRAVIRSRDRRGANEERVASSFVGSRRHLCVASPDKVSRRE